MADVHVMNPGGRVSASRIDSEMICGNPNPEVLFINSPSRLYDEDSKSLGERELTPYGLGSVATDVHATTDTAVGLLDGEYWGLSSSRIVEIASQAVEIHDRVTFCLNIMTPSFPIAIMVGKALKARFPSSRLVFGGPHATLDPESILHHIPSALVVVGEGESIVSTLLSGESADSVPGLVFLRHGKPVHVGFANTVHDLDALSWVNRDFFANEPYLKLGRSTMTFLSSRGCGARCSFCITPAQFEILGKSGIKRVRFRSMADVIREVAFAQDTHAIEFAQFIDDVMLPNKSRVTEFLHLWEAHALADKMEFTCLLRPDTITWFGDAGLLRSLYDAGLKRLTLGIETGHDRGRILMSGLAGRLDPKYKRENIVNAVRHCSSIGIATKGFFMIGLPGETRDEIDATLRFMAELRDEGLGNVAIFPVKVYPGTGLWNEAIRLGFTAEDLEHYDSRPVRALIDKGYSAKEASRDGFTQRAQLSSVPPAELQQLCQTEMHAFNGSNGSVDQTRFLDELGDLMASVEAPSSA